MFRFVRVGNNKKGRVSWGRRRIDVARGVT